MELEVEYTKFLYEQEIELGKNYFFGLVIGTTNNVKNYLFSIENTNIFFIDQRKYPLGFTFGSLYLQPIILNFMPFLVDPNITVLGLNFKFSPWIKDKKVIKDELFYIARRIIEEFKNKSLRGEFAYLLSPSSNSSNYDENSYMELFL